MAKSFQKSMATPCCLNDSDCATFTLFGEASAEQLARIPDLRGIGVIGINTGCATLHVRVTAAKVRELAALLTELADSLADAEVVHG